DTPTRLLDQYRDHSPHPGLGDVGHPQTHQIILELDPEVTLEVIPAVGRNMTAAITQSRQEIPSSSRKA
ncbi:MAG: hypothetical protein V3S26_09070, partial [Acidimicrobiia bacterium]